MDLSGAGAKAVVTLSLHGPLTLEELLGNSGVSRRRLWAGIAQAETLGLIARRKRGRTTLYISSLLPRLPDRDSPSSSPEKDTISSNSSIYTYRDGLGDILAPQGDKTAPGRDEPGDKTAPDSRPGDKTAPQGDILAPSGNILGDKTAPDDEELVESSPLDAIIAADQMRAPEVSGQRGSPYVLKRAAQREAISALWAELLPSKPVPPRTTLDRLLLEANNSAYFLGAVIQDMAATGKDIEWPVGYITKAVKGRKDRGNIPYLPVTETAATDEMTPELRAYFDRAEAEGQTYWGSDDD